MTHYHTRFDEEGQPHNVTINQESESIINGPRQESYGSPKDSFGRIAKFWSLILDTEVTPHQVILCMIALKTSRAIQGYHRDSYVDIAGYAGIAEMLLGKGDG